MKGRSVRSAVVSLSLALAAILGACTGPGAGKSTFESGDVQQNGKVTGDDDDDDNASSSGGAVAGQEVFGTKAFSYKAPTMNADDHGVTHDGQTPLEGKDCVVAGCHLDARPWAFAGTVYTGADSTTIESQAEIGVVYGNTVKTVMTDAQGNFWLEGTEFPPVDAVIGVRKAGGAFQKMIRQLPASSATTAGGRACNSAGECHGSITQRIWIK